MKNKWLKICIAIVLIVAVWKLAIYFLLNNYWLDNYIFNGDAQSQNATNQKISFAPDGQDLAITLKELKFIAEKNKQQNFVVSPLSFYALTILTANGLQGESRQEFNQILNNAKLKNLNTIFMNYIKDKKNSIKINNSIWGKYFNADYQALVKNELGGEALDPMGNTASINAWVEEKTNGMVKEALPDVNIDDRNFFLVNTVYFNNKWAIPFEKKATQKDTFYNLGGGKSSVMMMYKNEELKYYEDLRMQVIRLDYDINSSDFMTIYLPKPGVDFNKFVAHLSVAKLNPKFYKESVDIYLPKFNIEYDVPKPKELYQSFGISKIYETSFDFAPMLISNMPAKVEETILRAIVEVDENKTEAAAFSMHKGPFFDVASTPSKPIEFRADRPFVFMINQGDFIGAFVTGK